MRKVLIISPHFPPTNSPDMQRVRMSLPYFKELGWEPVVICVDEKFEEGVMDPLLNKTIPDDIEIHKVKAWRINITRKFKIGNLGIRSFIYFLKKGNQLLRKDKYDLIYFSTTLFHLCRLGPYWKKKFNIPFIIDIQDPWRNDFYLDKPKSERPPKFFISYNIDKYLEAKTIPKADGIISVSNGYCKTFMRRYMSMKSEQFKVIPFGASYYDTQIMEKFVHASKYVLPENKINAVYIGRGGFDMHYSLEIIFKAFKKGLIKSPEIFSKVNFLFIGTSYAAGGGGQKTIEPLAKNLNIDEYVTEMTDRIPYFESLYLLKKADILVVPGSIDTSYTASKIYSYILASKPLLAVFHKDSSVLNVLEDLNFKNSIGFDHTYSSTKYVDECLTNFYRILTGGFKSPTLNNQNFGPYTAKEKTIEQVNFFNDIISR